MIDKIRLILRILAIPFVILYCILGVLATIVWFIFCLFDLRPDEWEIFAENPINFISVYIKEGVRGL